MVEVVIKLENYDYFSIKNGGLYAIGHDRLDTVITEAVNAGVVLPQEHGRLLDESSLVGNLLYGRVVDDMTCGNLKKFLNDATVLAATQPLDTSEQGSETSGV